MANGEYSVTYNGLSGNGTLPGCGKVTLHDGKIYGSDAGYDWKGTYRLDGTHLYGSLLATPEHPVINIFGDGDPLDLEVIGVVAEGLITIQGIRKDRPEHLLSATLQPIKL